MDGGNDVLLCFFAGAVEPEAGLADAEGGFGNAAVAADPFAIFLHALLDPPSELLLGFESPFACGSALAVMLFSLTLEVFVLIRSA